MKMAASSAILLCQTSIHNFLTCIPSQASELAVNAVNNFLEDQVADPRKFERNLSRVKSVFSCRSINLLGRVGRRDGGGDCPNVESTLLLSLPRKVRRNIWKCLDGSAVKNLRLVCQQLKHEMDFDVGLSVVLTTASFRDPWIKSISINSCTISEIDTLLQLNHLARPEKLEKICLSPQLDIDSHMVELIVRKFRNLREMVVFTEDVAELRNFDEEAITKGTSAKLFSRLEEQFQLTSIDVKFDTVKWKLSWNIKLNPQASDNRWEVKDVIGPFGMSGIARVPSGRDLSRKSLKTATLSIPFVQDRDRYVWLQVLQTQTVLTSLTCDLNVTHWQEYAKIVQNNSRTLRKIFLLNISCAPDAHWTLLPFDWKMFEDCRRIEEITLIAESFLHASSIGIGTSQSHRYIENANLSSLESCQVLRALWLENFKLAQSDMEFLKQPTSDKEIGARFELCTLKNCMVDSVEVSELHVGTKTDRNRSLDCLCLGTTNYDDDLENFEKYTLPQIAHQTDSNTQLAEWDVMECFQASCPNTAQEGSEQSSSIIDNINILGGLALTAWLYWCN